MPPGIETRDLRAGGKVVGQRHVVRVRDPHPKPGKTGYTSATFATKPEAEQFVRDVDDRGVAWALAEYRRAKDESEELTLDEWAETHFDSLTEPSQAQVRRSRRVYEAHWKEPLGHMRLSQIERPHVAAALNAVKGKDKTRLNKWSVLTHMLKMAVEDGKIPRSPTKGVKLGRHTSHETEEHRYLTHAEFWKVLEATPEYWQPLVAFMAGTGMRWGEVAALTIGDIDTEPQLVRDDAGDIHEVFGVRVTKAEKQDPERPNHTVIGPPKSRAGRRTVTIAPEVLDAIQPLLKGRPRTARLFLPPKGGPLRHRTFYRDIWLKKSVGEAGIAAPHPRLHDLRHSHVAWLIARGVQLPVIQKRLGHEDIRTTINTYGHLLPDVQRAAALAAGSVLAARPPLELT